MKQLMIAVVLVGALTGTAADASYTYTAGATSLGDKAVAITYEEGTTDIKTLTASPTDGGTVTISGAMTFADGATITLASSGTVSFAEKVTTLGATTLARGDGAYLVWKGTALAEGAPGTLAFPGLKLSEIEFVSLVSSSNCPYAFVSELDSGFYLFNRVTSAYVYSARVQLTERTEGLYARCRTCARSPRLGLYPDEESKWTTGNLWGLWSKRADITGYGYYGLASDSAASGVGTYLGNPTVLGLTKIILRRKNAGLAGVGGFRPPAWCAILRPECCAIFAGRGRVAWRRSVLFFRHCSR